MNENYIGSDFDDFLKEEGLLEHCQAVAVKRVLAYQLQPFMADNQISKIEAHFVAVTDKTGNLTDRP